MKDFLCLQEVRLKCAGRTETAAAEDGLEREGKESVWGCFFLYKSQCWDAISVCIQKTHAQ